MENEFELKHFVLSAIKYGRYQSLNSLLNCVHFCWPSVCVCAYIREVAPLQQTHQKDSICLRRHHSSTYCCCHRWSHPVHRVHGWRESRPPKLRLSRSCTGEGRLGFWGASPTRLLAPVRLLRLHLRQLLPCRLRQRLGHRHRPGEGCCWQEDRRRSHRLCSCCGQLAYWRV